MARGSRGVNYSTSRDPPLNAKLLDAIRLQSQALVAVQFVTSASTFAENGVP
jgi:hypothetical protein